VARSGIYHLFKKLALQTNEVVLAPDYYSGNEVAAIQAAGASIVHYPVQRNLEPDLERVVEAGQTASSTRDICDPLPRLAPADEGNRSTVPRAR
jgi:hypothetical protein